LSKIAGKVLQTTAPVPPQVFVPELMCPKHSVNISVGKTEVNVQLPKAQRVTFIYESHMASGIGNLLAVIMERVGIGVAGNEKPRDFSVTQKSAISKRGYKYKCG
jgi:hypothetical protein